MGDDVDGRPKAAGKERSSKKQPSKPVTSAEEAELWNSFKEQVAQAVRTAVQAGGELPGVTGSVQGLAAKLAALLEKEASLGSHEGRQTPADRAVGESAASQAGDQEKPAEPGQQEEAKGRGRGSPPNPGSRAGSRSRSPRKEEPARSPSQRT